MENTDFIMVPNTWQKSSSIIKVIGVGGGGCNALNEMFKQGIMDVEFMICNTDLQSLKTNDVPEKLRLGTDITKGLGAGCDPERGRRAATESIDEIKRSLEGETEMVFITAGMGGGTGTGAAPVIAKVAKDMGKLTIGVVTLPFRDEGNEFVKRAVIGIKELQKHVDSLLIIDNQKLYHIFSELRISEAFQRANEVLYTAVKGIAEIITNPGFINVDFADVNMVMENSGMAIMGMGEAEGPDRAIEAVRKAFESPLLNDCDLTTAKGALVNITASGEDNGISMAELSQIMDYVNSYTGSPDKFKRGVVLNPSVGNKICVTVVATGFDMHNLPQVDISEKDDSAITLGDSGIYNTAGVNIIERKPTSKNIIVDTHQPFDNEDSLYNENSPSEIKIEDTPSVAPKRYEKPQGKPVMILEPGDDIKVLEQQPAYVRRNKKLSKAQHEGKPQGGESTRMRITNVDGRQQLTDNSYIHRTQD